MHKNDGGGVGWGVAFVSVRMEPHVDTAVTCGGDTGEFTVSKRYRNTSVSKWIVVRGARMGD